MLKFLVLFHWRETNQQGKKKEKKKAGNESVSTHSDQHSDCNNSPSAV